MMNNARSVIRKILKAVILGVTAVAVIMLVIWIYIAQPTMQSNQKSSVYVDENRLRTHVETLSVVIYPRNYREINNLKRCADYISKNFVEAGAGTEIQELTVFRNKYFNVIGRFGKDKTKQIIIGAHYDAVRGSPGADDNASGIAGLIELAYLIGRHKLDTGVELVAYSLEEPPFFRTEMMGSAIHAANIPSIQHVDGVIVLEMIGYYDKTWGSQSYPMPLLYILYPARGDFVAVVGRLNQRPFTKKLKVGMKGTADLPVYSINAPAFIPGLDFSDHRNYWEHGLNAVMVTDTGFYRNKEYHKAGDISNTLNYSRMAKVVIGIFEAIKTF